MAPDSFVSEFPYLLPCKLGAPSDFRQALPANGADGEAPVKVGGLRGARAARAKPRICFGRRWGAKKKEFIRLRWSMRSHAVVHAVSCGLMRWSMRSHFIAFVNPFCESFCETFL